MPAKTSEKRSIHPLSRAEWRQWLAEHHAETEGVWLVSYKRATGQPRLEYEEAVEEALCFGWIDSTLNVLDAERSRLWFAPRRAGSIWSRSNKERVERLIQAGAMTPAGLAKIEAAKKSGAWTALDELETLTIPPDLAAALAAYEPARLHFDAFPRSARLAILAWIASAKKPETRARRIEQTARLAAQNLRANEWRPPADAL
ncbi:MAG: YdeI/OmpD-associated family protein [Caldilineales bacterium]|nr:YdeI/OmpD-associated family protein [Caldilineales bacterium]MCW5857212.1 YdeI/OmpD-associated family protein [Caldilineales bacterium]